MQKVTYTIPGISCHHCVNTIQNELLELKGIHQVEANKDTKQVTINFDAPATEESIIALLREINYPPSTD